MPFDKPLFGCGYAAVGGRFLKKIPFARRSCYLFCMSKSIDARRHELILMSREELLGLWQKVTGASDEDTTKKSHIMIHEILEREFQSNADRV